MLGSSSHFFSTTELPRILHCGAARVYTEHLGHQNCSGKEGAGTTFRKNSRDRPAQSVSHTHLDLPTIACLGKSESFRDSRPQVTVPPTPPWLLKPSSQAAADGMIMTMMMAMMI